MVFPAAFPITARCGYVIRRPRMWVPSLRCGLVVLFVAVCCGAGAPARGAEDPELHIKKGIELRRLGRDQAALPEFQTAYAMSKTPRAAAQLGLCEQALGRWTDSAEHLAEALEHKSDPWIAKHRTTLETSLAAAKSRTGTVEVVGDPVGAEVFISGKLVARLPMPAPAPVNGGEVDVELRADGYKAASRSVNVAPGQYQRVVMRLERAAPVALPAAVAPTEEASVSAAARDDRADVPAESRRWYQRPWVWGAIGAVVAGGVVATVLATKTTEYPAANVTMDFPGSMR
jgi:hypothetical protein